MCTDPVRQLLIAGGLSVSVRAGSQHGDEQMRLLNGATARIVDRQLLETINVTLDDARLLWSFVEDVLRSSTSPASSLQDTLENATQVTSQLSQTAARVYENPVGASDKSLFDEALLFIKVNATQSAANTSDIWIPQTVAQVSIELKKFGSTHVLPSTVRGTAAKLAQSTKELAVLLHVSSYSPSASSTPTPYSEDVLVPPPSLLGISGNLSRSRSAQPTVSTKLHPLSNRDGPRSALPVNQRFNIPNIPPSKVSPSRSGLHNS